MTAFEITFNGKISKIESKNITSLQDKIIKENLLRKDGDFIEIKTTRNIFTITKDSTARHWKHNGYRFN